MSAQDTTSKAPIDFSGFTSSTPIPPELMKRMQDDKLLAAEVQLTIEANDRIAKAGALHASQDARNNQELKAGLGGFARDTKSPVPKKFSALTSTYGGANADDVLRAIGSATASKVRAMSVEESNAKFEELCDFLVVPEDKNARLAFRYSLIGWIYLNTASTENGIDSLIGGEYSSARMLQFFGHDLRPFARSLAEDAYTFAQVVTSIRDHPLHADLTRLAQQYGVPKTPWLLFDGMDARHLTAGEFRIYGEIKTDRLERANAAPVVQRRSRGEGRSPASIA